MTGSDLKELCAAAMQECMAEEEEEEQGAAVRVLNLTHFESACR